MKVSTLCVRRSGGQPYVFTAGVINLAYVAFVVAVHKARQQSRTQKQNSRKDDELVGVDRSDSLWLGTANEYASWSVDDSTLDGCVDGNDFRVTPRTIGIVESGLGLVAVRFGYSSVCEVAEAFDEHFDPRWLDDSPLAGRLLSYTEGAVDDFLDVCLDTSYITGGAWTLFEKRSQMPVEAFATGPPRVMAI